MYLLTRLVCWYSTKVVLEYTYSSFWDMSGHAAQLRRMCPREISFLIYFSKVSIKFGNSSPPSVAVSIILQASCCCVGCSCLDSTITPLFVAALSITQLSLQRWANPHDGKEKNCEWFGEGGRQGVHRGGVLQLTNGACAAYITQAPATSSARFASNRAMQCSRKA